jgi:hypothetical protein
MSGELAICFPAVDAGAEVEFVNWKGNEKSPSPLNGFVVTVY